MLLIAWVLFGSSVSFSIFYDFLGVDKFRKFIESEKDIKKLPF